MTKIKTTLALAVLATGLHAQTTPVTTVTAEEIHQLPDLVVTGALWESELARTTASVTAFDAERLAVNGTQHFGDIINAIPNLTWTGGTSRPRYIQIRGIGENSQFEGETPDSSVRFLVDDLDFTGLGGIGNLFDVQQVEVLRGPQAGAFGVNAAGGVIQIVTNEPTAEWSGQVEGTIGQDNLISTGFAIGGPLLKNNPEELTFRFAVNQLKQDGFRENQFLGRDDTNERDELNARLKLRWIASEDWQWDATLFYAEADNGYDEWTLDNTGFNTQSDEPGRDWQESYAGSIRGTWTGLDNVIVTNILSGTQTDSIYSYDGDWSDAASVTHPDLDNPGEFIDFSAFVWLDRDRSRWSEELRLDSAQTEGALGFIDRWTLGGYFEDLSEDSEFGGDWGGFKTTYDARTYSVFGQGTHLFSDSTRLIVGLRAEYFDLETESEGRDDVDFDEWLFGGKITLEHDLNEDHMLFGSVARGYKAGGANIYPNEDITNFGFGSYDTEHLWNYEIGLRSKWLDGDVVTNVTAFYLDREDAQFRDSVGAGVTYGYFTNNADSAEHYGLEADATWYICKQLSLSAGLGLLETETNYVDRDLSNSPNYTYNARIDYQSECGFFANFEVSGSDDYFESNSHEEKREEFAVFNAAVGYRYESWTLTVWGKNLFDRDYEKRLFRFANDTPDYSDVKRFENPADPQQFGVTLNYAW